MTEFPLLLTVPTYMALTHKHIAITVAIDVNRLVYETPEFLPYFRATTPISEIAQLNIGSRPSARTASAKIEDLRAIPWVFSWSQTRIMLVSSNAAVCVYGCVSVLQLYCRRCSRTTLCSTSSWSRSRFCILY